MKYNPTGEDSKSQMLSTIGVGSVSELFSAIPKDVQLERLLDVAGPVSEFQILKDLNRRAATYPVHAASFLGAGAYRRFIPAAIEPLVTRAEFMTSYTPYQPEVSQGNLQAMFEFQTMLAELTGMDVANASMYEAATAAAEAVLMAYRINPKRKKILVSQGLHPEYREVISTYLRFQNLTVTEIPLQANGQTDLAALKAQLDDQALCSLLQVVNFYGVIEDQKAHQETLAGSKCLNIAVLSEMTSLGLIEAPGNFGADIFVGEGQSLGLPLSFGGPYVGVFACKEEYMRKMPGRLSGMTQDSRGNRAFCLTLSTREQHIRREKATSNICSNQALMALWVSVYLAMMGKSGLKELALMNYSKAKKAQSMLAQIPGVKLRHSAAHYNEFVVELKHSAQTVVEKLLAKNILAGVPLSRFNPADDKALLVTVTEVNELTEITQLAAALKEVL